jgi:hypothetical protein
VLIDGGIISAFKPSGSAYENDVTDSFAPGTIESDLGNMADIFATFSKKA